VEQAAGLRPAIQPALSHDGNGPARATIASTLFHDKISQFGGS
jgi:hypothetical protein